VDRRENQASALTASPSIEEAARPGGLPPGRSG